MSAYGMEDDPWRDHGDGSAPSPQSGLRSASSNILDHHSHHTHEETEESSAADAAAADAAAVEDEEVSSSVGLVDNPPGMNALLLALEPPPVGAAAGGPIMASAAVGTVDDPAPPPLPSRPPRSKQEELHADEASRPHMPARPALSPSMAATTTSSTRPRVIERPPPPYRPANTGGTAAIASALASENASGCGRIGGGRKRTPLIAVEGPPVVVNAGAVKAVINSAATSIRAAVDLARSKISSASPSDQNANSQVMYPATVRPPLTFFLSASQISLITEDVSSNPASPLVTPRTRLPSSNSHPLRLRSGTTMDDTIALLQSLHDDADPFAIFPLASHSHPRATATAAPRVLVNLRRLVEVHGFAGDGSLPWTTFVIEGDARAPPTLASVVGAASASMAHVVPGVDHYHHHASEVETPSSAIGGSGLLRREEGSGLVSFEVAMPIGDVLRIIDGDSFPISLPSS